MHPIHPMVVHFPIALLLASTPVDALAFRWRRQQFRDTSLSLLVLGILAGRSGGAHRTFRRGGGGTQRHPETGHRNSARSWAAPCSGYFGLLGLRLASVGVGCIEQPMLVLDHRPGAAGCCC